MVRLTVDEIRTREVLDWQGIHLLHAPMSSCSQKVRIALALKKLAWRSHVIDVLGKENLSAWYLGINPRGLVPALVLDGEVHVESNDILLMLERNFPAIPLSDATQLDQLKDLLRHEDDLHLDLRRVTFRFLIPADQPPKSHADLVAYEADGAGTIGGEPDASKSHEISFWRTFLDNGISDDAACQSVGRFQHAFDELERSLERQPYLQGGSLGLLDIAWAVYANRLVLCGYPLARLYPNVGAWFDSLRRLPEVAHELEPPLEVAADLAARMQGAHDAGRSLPQVCHL